MKGHAGIIEILNQLLEGELSAIHQYLLHSRMCKDWGYNKLADHFSSESTDEMQHAEELTDRILFLGGTPCLKSAKPAQTNKTVKEQMETNLALELKALSELAEGIKLCEKEADHGTNALLQSIFIKEEHHVEWLESQIRLIKEVGEPAYLARQI